MRNLIKNTRTLALISLISWGASHLALAQDEDYLPPADSQDGGGLPAYQDQYEGQPMPDTMQQPPAPEDYGNDSSDNY